MDSRLSPSRKTPEPAATSRGRLPHTPNLPDAHAILKLISETAITPGGISHKRRRLLSGIAELIHADTWIWTVRTQTPDLRLRTDQCLTESSKEDTTTRWAQARLEQIDRSPEMANLQPLLTENTHISRAGWQLHHEEGHAEKTPHANSLWSYRTTRITPLKLIGTIFFREPGQPRFRTEDIQTVHMISTAVSWLNSDNHQHAHPSTDLPPRLARVLKSLLDGQSAKQIAYEHHLSEYTVRGYIKEIYKHLGVSSRAELHKHFMPDLLIET